MSSKETEDRLFPSLPEATPTGRPPPALQPVKRIPKTSISPSAPYLAFLTRNTSFPDVSYHPPHKIANTYIQ